MRTLNDAKMSSLKDKLYATEEVERLREERVKREPKKARKSREKVVRKLKSKKK